MASRKRISVVGYAGVFYVEAPRVVGSGIEKIYYIRYRRDKKLIEEKVGGQYRDNMTPAKASAIRGNRIEGKDLSNEQKRLAIQKMKEEAESRYSFARLWELFQKDRGHLRSIINDRGRYKHYIEPYINNKTIPELTMNDIDNIRKGAEKEGRSPKTIKHVLELVRRILNFALQKGYVDSISGKLHIVMPKVDNKVTENLTQAQIQKLLEVLDNQDDQVLASVMRIALYTGIRKSAILHLQWQDLDFENSFIVLQGTFAKKGTTETIPMNNKAKEIFQKIPQGTNVFVFTSPLTGEPYKNIAKFLQKVAKEAELPKGFRPMHGLRHVFASWLASSGQVTMYELQKLLTHSNPQETQRYAHLHDDALKKASDVASNLFGKAEDAKKA